MDYEKKYKDALERLRAFHRDYDNISNLVDVKRELESIFPELRESEDERIIKTLQEYVKNRNWRLNGPTQDEVLAWLEKQKERKSAWNEEDKRILKGIIGKIAHDQTYGVSKVEMLSFLKSLRPSWKPSEEQMAAFSRFITYCMTQVNTGCYKQVGDIRLVEQIYLHLPII